MNIISFLNAIIKSIAPISYLKCCPVPSKSNLHFLLVCADLLEGFASVDAAVIHAIISVKDEGCNVIDWILIIIAAESLRWIIISIIKSLCCTPLSACSYYFVIKFTIQNYLEVNQLWAHAEAFFRHYIQDIESF